MDAREYIRFIRENFREVAAGLLLILTIFGMVGSIIGSPNPRYTAMGFSNIDDSVKNAISSIWDKITGFFNNIFGSISNAISGFFNSLKGALNTVVQAMVSPFRYAANAMMDAWSTATQWFDKLGPFAPLAVLGIIAAMVFIVWHVAKGMLPGI